MDKLNTVIEFTLSASKDGQPFDDNCFIKKSYNLDIAQYTAVQQVCRETMDTLLDKLFQLGAIEQSAVSSQ